MSERFNAGMVRIAVDMSGGRVVGRAVRCDRPRGLGAELRRHPAAEIPGVARRLFALCGVSHSIAATNALVIAGAAISAPSDVTTVRWLAAERITAHLQATFIGWSAMAPMTTMETSALSRALTQAKGSAIDGDRLIEPLTALGLSIERPAGSWADRLVNAANDGGGGGEWGDLDALSAADDEQVLAALDQDEAFAAAPWLPDRRPETGPAARAALRGVKTVTPGERLGARLSEITEAADVMAGRGRADPRDWWVAGQCAPGLGYCAVESPRGRLYHLAQLHLDGSLKRCLILAPTEWNFAANGPFAAALESLSVGGRDARKAIERLASLYDPCVGCDIDLRQAAIDETRPPRHCNGAYDGRRATL